MAASAASRDLLPRKTLEVWLAPSLVGLSLLFVICVFGFEEPNEWLLLAAALLTLATPAAVLVHLYRTPMLTSEEKRFWLLELTSLASASALADYLTATDHRSVTLARMRRRSGAPRQ